MRAREFINEDVPPASGKKLAPDQVASIKGAISIPGISINKSSGSSYMNYRFGIALAGAPEYPTLASGAISGDPLLSTYTDEELEMVNFAAQQVGAGKVTKLSDNRSRELDNVQKTSPVAKPKRNKYGV